MAATPNKFISPQVVKAATAVTTAAETAYHAPVTAVGRPARGRSTHSLIAIGKIRTPLPTLWQFNDQPHPCLP